MKKKRKFTFLLLSLFCTSCNQVVAYDVLDYRTTMKFHDDFKIMQLTDLHLGIESDVIKQLNFVCDSINQVDPDLIILTGDNFMYGTKGIVDTLFETINNKCKQLSNNHVERITKFAVTYGNHDNQGDYYRYYINKSIQKYVTKVENATI